MNPGLLNILGWPCENSQINKSYFLSNFLTCTHSLFHSCKSIIAKNYIMYINTIVLKILIFIHFQILITTRTQADEIKNPGIELFSGCFSQNEDLNLSVNSAVNKCESFQQIKLFTICKKIY